MDSYELFLERLRNVFDLDLTGYKRPQMERRINTLMRSFNIGDYDGFVDFLQRDRAAYARFVNHVTINVSEFYRNPGQWQILTEQHLPELLAESPHLKIWSAGCSTGEECYTMAMILAEYAPRGQHRILATDIDERVLAKAQAGVYSAKTASGIPPNLLRKYFTLTPENNYQAGAELKNYLDFKYHNLLRDAFPGQMDLIICRNVVIYFTEETKFLLYQKFFRALRPKGILFTGSTEQIVQAREIGFESGGTFFYRRP